MFGLFKSKESSKQDSQVTEVGKMLFQQISIVRDKANAGRIDKSVFNQRINSMFAAGYLMGYVDEHLAEITTDEKQKSKYAKRIFEGIFPGSGAKFIQSKLAARRVGDTISTDNERYLDVFSECQEFDTGISSAKEEASHYLAMPEYTPKKLERYLSTGEIE